MDLTVHHAEGLSLIRHNQNDGQTILSTLIIKHRDGEMRIEMFSREPITFTIGEEKDE
jgi:hypothetical protein